MEEPGMRHGIKRLICCGIAAAAIMTFVAGCSVNDKKNDRSDRDKGSSGFETVDGSKEENSDRRDTSGSGWTAAPAQPFIGSGSVDDINYSVVTDTAEGRSDARGYCVFEDESDEYPVKVVIQAGEFNTGGYDIEVVDVQIDGGIVIITVEETSPGSGDIVTQAFTYPWCSVGFSRLPDGFKVVNTEGYEFERIK